MTKKPPVPEENQSPYPIEEPPHDDVGDVEAKQEEAARTRKWVAAGAAVGIGSAALVGALLYGRSKGKKDKA
ncbi:hypothetical protein [Sphingosinithalassobacter portus]|uniref:hypothetical protein n=1 Tax=Stakelama portus TaxID=2676234 RepID=UPI000D6E1B97|nr:hypothetical protein [Sphingosinithalassobacter portus]